MLTLRDGLAAPTNLLNYADEGLAASYRELDAAGTNPVKRGWVSTSEGLRGSELLAEANAAERAGDMLRAQQLELQAQDHMQRAQTWAPTTQNFTDINGVGSAANWVGGQVGSGARSMIAPLAGGIGGRVLGGIAGGLIAGPGGVAVGANLGGLGGAFVPSYDMQYNESVGQAMMDPGIRAKRSAEEIHRTGQGVGAVGGALDAMVPASIAKVGMGGLAKRSIGNVIAREAGEEFLTEGAQNYVGQTGQNYLSERTGYDHLEAFNSAMAGAVGGGAMGVGGAAVGAVRDKLAAGGEKVADVARDPVQAAVDAVHRVVKGDPVKRADREIAEFEAGQRPLGEMFEEERATANDERIFDAPAKDETDEMLTGRMREDADRWADRILSSPPRTFGPREEELRNAAAQYKSDGDWSKLRGVLRKNKLSEERGSMMSSFEPEGSKASEMSPEGQELDTLSQAWLKNEGKRYGGYFDDGSDEAKGLGAKLFAWIKNDFGKKLTEDGEIFIPRAFIETLGERAPGVVESAITAARKEGWDIKDAGDAVATIRQYVSSNEGDTSFLTSAIRYSQQENWTPKMAQRFAKELRQKGGRLDKDDYKWLKTQVGDIAGVLEHFQKPSRFYKAENKLKSPSTKDELQSDLGLESAKGGDTDSGSDITENDGDWNSGVNTFSAPKSTINVLGIYDIADPDQLTEMKAGDGEEMGIVDHARRTLSGPSLSRRLRELTNEYDAPLAEINRRVRMKVDIKDEAQATGIGPGHVEKLRVSTDAFNSATKKRDPIDGKDRGVLFVEVRDGDPFVTSSAKLINTVRQDKDTESSQYGVAETEDRMLQGLGQLMAAMPEAGMIPTGRVGYKNKAGGGVTWLREAGSKMRSSAGGQGALPFGPSAKLQGLVHPLNLPDDFNFIEKSKADGYSRANARAQRQSRFKQSVDAETDLNMRDLKDMTVPELEALWGDIADKGLGLLTAKKIATKKLEKNAENLTKAFNQAKKRGDMTRISELNKQLTAAEAELQKAKEPLQRAMDTLRDQLNTIRDEIESRTQVTSGIKYVTDDFGTQQLVKRGKERVPGDRKLAANVSEKNTGDTLTKETNDETKNSDGGIYGSRRLAEAAAKPGERVRKFARGRWLIERKTGGIETTSRVVSPTETEEFAQNAKEKEIKRDLETGYEITTEPTDVEGWWKGENGPWKDLPLPTTNLNAPDIVKARVYALLKKGVPAANFAIGNMRLDALKRMAEMLRTKFWHDMPQYEGDSLVEISRLDDFKEKKSVREKVAAKRAEANKRLAARKKIDERAEMMLDKIQSRLKEIGDGTRNDTGVASRGDGRVEATVKKTGVRSISNAGGKQSAKQGPSGIPVANTGRDVREQRSDGKVVGTVPSQQGRNAEDGVTAKQDAWAKFSEQTTSDFKQINPEQALADIAHMLGKDFDAKVVEKLGGKAGMWKPGIIRMATSAADGTQFHEALHELFNQMRTHGASNVAQVIERVANSPLILRKLEQLLSDHPNAIKQLKSPEEAAAYLFQFWNMGLINVGLETKSLFQTIKDLIVDAAKELHSWINAAKRDERKAEKAQKMDEAEVRRLFEALAGGAAATSDVNVRQALYDGLRKNIEAHTKAVEDLGQSVEGFWQGLGRYVITSESMLNLYSKHPELKTVADKFHQMAGKSMKNQARNSSLMARGGLIEAKHAEVQRRLNPFERFLMDGKYDEKDMALAAKHLEANTQSADKKINALIDFVHGYYSEMYDYMVQSDVRRLDPHSEERWVPIQKRKDYFTQSWSIEELTKDHDGFVSTLIGKHAKELEYMAQQANAEIAAWNKNPKTKVESVTAKAEVDLAKDENRSAQSITPEMIAEQIYVRLLNSTGMVDIQETNWSLGLTPAAGAVNRRELDWLDKEAFSKYKSKDLVEIVTNYTRTMVARAEYQKRFGYGGEVIGDAMDTAMLREMGGQALVDSANASLDAEITRWKKDARAWHKNNPGVPYSEPYPTLRLVGIKQHRAQVGADASNEALIKAEKTLRPAVNAVRALEGTLGNDISPAMRSFSSWINTYQNVRLLPLALFTNFSDVIGITTNGGTLGDAWNAFTAGMREVRNTWLNEKGSDNATLRAEEWGVSDAGAMLDTLGQNYSSVYMTEKARNINNKFFRIIGMEGWNRGVRITATSVGERIIGDWVKNGVDSKKPGEKARFERLFGEGANPKKIKLDADGNLDTQDAANRAAIQRFVQDSVMSSNSAVRAIWMSDPRMATFAHLKNFAYAFHSVMLKGVLAQAAEGNLRPALVAGLGFASISIAAAAVKEMLIPGDEPYWMKGGLDGYLEYGYGMANLGGVPQMYLEGVTQFDPAKLAGPFWDQIQNTLSSPLPGFGINLSPFEGETELLRDRKVMVELAKALPAGNLAGRAMDSLVGD